MEETGAGFRAEILGDLAECQVYGVDGATADGGGKVIPGVICPEDDATLIEDVVIDLVTDLRRELDEGTERCGVG